MAAKKKTQKKKTRAKKAGSRRAKPAKKLIKRIPSVRKKSAKRKAVKKKAIKRSSATRKKAATRKTANRRTGRDATVPFTQERSRASSGGQSGDLQGLSGVERADSESVDELLEEGNAFEAGIVSGVEDAGDADEGEVRTREVPEDDVPGEYLDKD
jgi:hypothetical protein